MSKTDIIVLVFVGLFVIFRLYQKKKQKEQGSGASDQKSDHRSEVTHGSDYEPYSGKKE